MARNLSALKAMTPNKEHRENKCTVDGRAKPTAEPMVLKLSGSFSFLDFSSMTRNEMYKGCSRKPTPRSETARLRSNVFKGFGNDAVFLIA